MTEETIQLKQMTRLAIDYEKELDAVRKEKAELEAQLAEARTSKEKIHRRAQLAERDRDIWKKSRDAACLDRDELSEKLESAEARAEAAESELANERAELTDQIFGLFAHGSICKLHGGELRDLGVEEMMTRLRLLPCPVCAAAAEARAEAAEKKARDLALVIETAPTYAEPRIAAQVVNQLTERAERAEQAEARDVERTLGAHLNHCNFGAHTGQCKYGKADCPALSEGWSWIGAAVQRAEAAEAQLAEANADARRNIGVLRQQLENCHETMRIEGVRHAKLLLAVEDDVAEIARLRATLAAIHERARLGGGEAGLAGEEYALVDVFTLAQDALQPAAAVTDAA